MVVEFLEMVYSVKVEGGQVDRMILLEEKFEWNVLNKVLFWLLV